MIKILVVDSFLFCFLRMAKYYAVARGRAPGVYTDWGVCKNQVVNVPNAKYKKFNTHEEAAEFVKMYKNLTPTKDQVVSSVKLPLPLSPAKNDNTPKVQLDLLSQKKWGSSPPQNLSLPLSLKKNGSSAKRLNFEVLQKVPEVSFPLATPLVNGTKSPNIAGPSHSSAVGVLQPRPSIRDLDNLERFEVFEKMYLEFHKQMISEIRGTKKQLQNFKKLKLKNTSVQMQLQSSVANGMSSLENIFKTVMVNFSSELSSLQKLMALQKIETAGLTIPEKSPARKNGTRAAKSSVNGTRNKLAAMMQPMTPTQVLVANKRSYSTDGARDDEPADKIARIDTLGDVIVIKDEPADEADGVHQFITDAQGYVHVYTDGACEKNGRYGAKAGIGVWFGENHPLNSSEPVNGRATNNVAEIQAAEFAVHLSRRAGILKLCVNTDSQFLINSITKWIHGWKKRKWQLATGGPVKNKENFLSLEEAMKGMDVKWNYVPGHAGVLGNERADALARAGAVRYKNS